MATAEQLFKAAGLVTLAEAMESRLAIFSADRRHRLWLSRHKPDLYVEDSYGRALFVMLNPSTADEGADDATIRRCLGFARRMGASNIGIVNLFTYCATSPWNLHYAAERNSPDADAALGAALLWLEAGKPHRKNKNSRLIFAYGAPPWAGRDAEKAGPLMREQAARIRFVHGLAELAEFTPFALGLTKDGWPRHPSRLPYGTQDVAEGDDHLQPVPAAHFEALP